MAAAPWLFIQLGVVYLISMLSLIGIYSIVVLGLDLGLGYGGQINLGLQGFMAIGAYTVAILTTKQWVPFILAQPIIALIMGVVASFLFGLAASIPILRTIEKVPFSLAAIAFGLTIYMLISGSAFLGATLGITGIPAFSIGPIIFDTAIEMYYLVWIIVGLLLLFARYMVNSQWGLAIRCICSDDRTAEALGINVSKYRLEVFVLSAVFAGISGALFAFHMRGVDPSNFAFGMMLLFLFALYFGGERTIYGAIIGTLIIFLIIPEFIDLLSSPFPWIRKITELLQGIVFILILYFLPGGMFSLLRKTGLK
jgi:branched-chain amino acid transport system permease protein